MTSDDALHQNGRQNLIQRQKLEITPGKSFIHIKNEKIFPKFWGVKSETQTAKVPIFFQRNYESALLFSKSSLHS